jgi:hypothetical protein
MLTRFESITLVGFCTSSVHATKDDALSKEPIQRRSVVVIIVIHDQDFTVRTRIVFIGQTFPLDTTPIESCLVMETVPFFGHER